MIFKELHGKLTHKVKKVIAGASAVALLAGSLTGCSSAELELMNMSKEVNSWSTYTTRGNVNIEINENAKDFFITTIDTSDVVETPDIPRLVEVSYTLKGDSSNSIYDFDGSLKIDNEVYPVKVRVNDKAVALSRETVRTIVDILSKYYTDEIPEELNTILESLKGDEYLNIADAISFNNPEELKKASENIIDGITKVFEKYSTEVVSKNNAGEVEIKLDIDNVEKIILSLFDYVENNRADIIAGLNSLTPELKSTFGIDETTDIEDCVPTKEEIANKSKNIKESMSSEEYKKIKEDLKNSYYKGVYSLNDNVYKANSNLVIDIKNIDILRLNVSSETKKEDNLVFNDLNMVDYKDIVGDDFKTDALITIRYEAGSNTARMTKQLNNMIDLNTTINIHIIDDRAYLPMREIAEALGYKVQWDAKESKAYVIVDGKNIDMTGAIIDDITYVKVRDFEKLGFYIQYNENNKTGIRIIKIDDRVF